LRSGADDADLLDHELCARLTGPTGYLDGMTALGVLLGLVASMVVHLPAKKVLTAARPFKEWPREQRLYVVSPWVFGFGTAGLWTLGGFGGAFIETGKPFIGAACFVACAALWWFLSRGMVARARQTVAQSS